MIYYLVTSHAPPHACYAKKHSGHGVISLTHRFGYTYAFPISKIVFDMLKLNSGISYDAYRKMCASLGYTNY